MKAKEFKSYSLQEAKTKLAELRKEYLETRFKSVVGYVASPIIKRKLRRQIAQLNTIIREFELGIRG